MNQSDTFSKVDIEMNPYNNEGQYLNPHDNNSVILDLDTTISDNNWRLELLNDKKIDWEEFHSLSSQDKVIPHTQFLIQTLVDQNIEINIFSGRPESTRAQNEEWLGNHKIKFSRMFLRPNPERIRNCLLKERFLSELIELSHKKILFALDDDPAVINMYEANGVATFKLHQKVKVSLQVATYE